MIDFDALLTDDEKAAIATLEAGGFISLAEARLNDCRDLNSGKRMRTFRLRGRYDIIIACRKLTGRSASVSVEDTTVAESAVALKPIGEMSRGELLEEANGYDEITGEYALKKAELAEVVQKARDKRSGNTT
jgi:hypothetical protein